MLAAIVVRAEVERKSASRAFPDVHCDSAEAPQVERSCRAGCCKAHPRRNMVPWGDQLGASATSPHSIAVARRRRVPAILRHRVSTAVHHFDRDSEGRITGIATREVDRCLCGRAYVPCSPCRRATPPLPQFSRRPEPRSHAIEIPAVFSLLDIRGYASTFHAQRAEAIGSTRR